MNGFIIETHGYQICEAINKDAPDLNIELHSYSAKTTAELVSGELDFALICRIKHPLVTQTIEMKSLAKHELAGLIVPEFNDKSMVVQRFIDDKVVLKPKFRCQQVNPILKK